MPRDINGTYTLPAGNPVVTGTIISSPWANNTLSDIGSEITQSLDRSGDGGMLAGLKLFAGVIGAPGLTWSLEVTSGLYRAGAGDFRFSVASVDILRITPAGLTVTGTFTPSGVILAADGALGAPSYSFASDTDIGLYRVGVNALGIATAGLNAVNIDASQRLIVGPTAGFTDDLAAQRAIGVTSVTNNDIVALVLSVQEGVNNPRSQLFVNDMTSTCGINISASITVPDYEIRRIGTANLRLKMDGTGQLQLLDGLVSAPSHSFSGDTDTGMYRIGVDILGFTIGGAEILRFDTGRILVPNGVVGSPIYSFLADPDTGLYRVNPNSLGFSVGGARVFYVNNTAGVLQIFAENGTVVAPIYSFNSDPGTGFYRAGLASIGITGGGIFTGAFSAASGSAQQLGGNGSVAFPYYTFDADQDTGIYRVGANQLGISTGSTLRFVFESDGRIYGTGLHNNVGAVTGITNQYIASGTYTPILTNVTNIDASTPRLCQWMRVGNVVTVSGQFDVDTTTISIATELGMSLPIASAFTTAFQLGGGWYPGVNGSPAPATILADAVNDRARFQWGSSSTANITVTFIFMYEVV